MWADDDSWSFTDVGLTRSKAIVEEMTRCFPGPECWMVDDRNPVRRSE